MLKSDEFYGVLFAVLWRLILVLALQFLLSNIFSYAVLDGLVPFHIKLNGDKFLFPGRLVVNIYALHYILDFAFE